MAKAKLTSIQASVIKSILDGQFDSLVSLCANIEKIETEGPDLVPVGTQHRLQGMMMTHDIFKALDEIIVGPAPKAYKPISERKKPGRKSKAELAAAAAAAAVGA